MEVEGTFWILKLLHLPNFNTQIIIQSDRTSLFYLLVVVLEK